ncbi:MAG TPA: hypothetical protein VEI97_00815, partial [bacterium]|nr:hypothetical protein [bacterium]
MPVLVPSTAGQRASALTTPLPRSIPQAIAGWWFDLLLLLPLIPLYLLPNYAYNYDGVIYSGYVRHGDWSQMVHPHHLAYMPALHGLSRLLEGWGLSPHPYELLSILSRVSGLAALLVVGHGFRR